MVVGVNAAPIHPYCRCTAVPYFNDEFTNGERWSRKYSDDITDPVPEKMTYTEWKEKYLKDPQRISSEPHEERSLNELKQVASDMNKSLDDHVSRKSNWNNKIVLSDKDNAAPIGKHVSLTKDASDPTVIHELLHTRSSWEHDSKMYIKHFQTEEASVEFATREISKKMGYDVLEAEDDVNLLYKINEYAKINKTDYGFAMDLFNQGMLDREQWLIERISNCSENITEEQKDFIYSELSRWGWFDVT